MPDLSPAEELRAAAKLMRERAAEATDGVPPADEPSWCPVWTYSAIRHVQRNCDIECGEHGYDCNSFGRYAGPYIASWHPAVALAVADWLAEVAADSHPSLPSWVEAGALKIARAYLGTAEPAATGGAGDGTGNLA